MAWHDDRRLESREFVQNVDPVVGVDVRVERRKVRHDGKLTGQDEVAREQHVVVNQHDLVVRSVRRSVVTQQRSVATELQLQLSVRNTMSGSTNSTLRSRGVSSGRRRENVSMYPRPRRCISSTW